MNANWDEKREGRGQVYRGQRTVLGDYTRSVEKAAKPCLFCQIAAGKLPAHVVLENNELIAFLDKSPLQAGHILLIPKPHVPTFAQLPPEQTGEFFKVAQRLTVAVEEAIEAEGTFVAMNNKVSQSVPHLHLHIVPRKKGDGLKGFFWPRKKYASDDEAAEIAHRIHKAAR
jgi:histidine triad (HIT) family protein